MGSKAATTRKGKQVSHPPPRAPPPQPSSSGISSLFNFIARLLAWYGLYTVLFQCPANPGPEDPTICQASHKLRTTLQPHVQPYYDAYLAPYVEQYTPYVQHANEIYLMPVYTQASASYQKYAEPKVQKGQKLAQEQYAKVVKPQLDVVAGQGQVYYQQYLSSHVNTASAKLAEYQPHLEKAKASAESFHQNTVLPAYEKALPHMQRAYEQVRYVVMTFVAPVVRDGGEKAVGWGAGVWKDVIGPQVGRIGERLGGGSNGNGVPAASVSSSIFSSLSATDTSKDAAATASLSSVRAKASADSSDTKKHSKEEVREIVENDLKTWKEKYASASEKATADLAVHIDDICIAAHAKESGHVDKAIAQLAALVDSSTAGLKSSILSIVRSSETPEEKNARLADATRKAGTAIHDAAAAQRSAAQAFLRSMYDSVAEAADSHIDVLDSVSDVGLQEIGMRWAWIDYVTYKDWARYHDLKKAFADERRDVVRSAEANEKLAELVAWAEKAWEGAATEVAKDAAAELMRLKEVGARKIELGDDSDDWSGSFVPVQAVKAGQAVADGAETVKEGAEAAVEAVEEKVAEVVEEVKSAAVEAETKVEEAVYGSETPVTESVASVVSEKIYGTEPGVAEKVATAVKEAVVGSEEPTPLTEEIAATISAATEKVKEAMPEL